MRTIVTLILLILIFCSSSKDKMKKDTKKEIEKITKTTTLATFETLVVAQMGGFVSPQIRIIKEEQALREVYGQVNKTRKPGFSLPKIDFTKETIVAIFMGEKNTGGYAVKVVSVLDKEAILLVTVQESQPKANAMVITALTQPICIVKINSANKNIVFEKK